LTTNEDLIPERSASFATGMTPKLRALLNRLLGARGERAAARHLKRQGMRILVRGYRTPLGEIDLIARDGDTLVFVEVKARRQGVPAEAVTPEKERRLTLAALHFLRRYNALDVRSRFDIVAIVWPDDRRSPRIEHFAGAFDAVGRGQMFR
jgi:putative endonuclease